jgi:signal peptidase I
MAAIAAPVVARGEPRVVRASQAPCACPHRAYSHRASRHRAVSRDGDEVPTASTSDVTRPDMFGASTTIRSPSLHRAARWGDLRTVTRLLDTPGVDVNQGDENGSTALMWASQFGHDEVVKVLLRKNADKKIRNKFNWSAAEYAYTSSLAGDVLPLVLFSAEDHTKSTTDNSELTQEVKTTTIVIPSLFFANAYGALIVDYSPETVSRKFAKAGGPAGSPQRMLSIVNNTLLRYRESASRNTRDMKDKPRDITRNGTAIAGCTCKPLGLYAGQRYFVKNLFWRSVGVGVEERVPEYAMDERPPDTSNTSNTSPWRLCAELTNPTWTPWGSVEVDVNAAELRSVFDELFWAIGVTVSFSTLLLLTVGVTKTDLVQITSVNSNSMAPTILKGDTMLVDKRRRSIVGTQVGDVVFFSPPPKLVEQIKNTVGVGPGPNDFFVKRVVAVAGDVIAIENGKLTRNGILETWYASGTPVGVDPGVGGSRGKELSSRSADCEDVCKPGTYSLDQTTVPPGSLFLLGDNRGKSNDGHVWGYLPVENVAGKIISRVFPVARFGRLAAK